MGLPCKPGCSCAKHQPRPDLVARNIARAGMPSYKRTFAHCMAARAQLRPDTAQRNRLPRSVMVGLRASQSMREYWKSNPRPRGTTGGLRRTSGNFGFSGAETGDAFAAVLCPAGYLREHFVRYGSNRYDHYKIDFAHPVAKVAIELDGPYHQATEEEDACRDTRLRALEWKVIRIRHD